MEVRVLRILYIFSLIPKKLRLKVLLGFVALLIILAVLRPWLCLLLLSFIAYFLIPAPERTDFSSGTGTRQHRTSRRLRRRSGQP
jgi:hypothetical protein